MHKRIFLVLLLASAGLFAQTATDLNYGQQLSHDSSTQPGTWNYTWWGKAGRHYFVQTSTDLVNWTTLQNFNPRGTEAVLGVSLTDTGLPTIFTRLVVFDPSQQADSVEDTDGNGLPDVWEMYYFGHIGVDPNGDPDGDGLTNLREFQHGGNPLVASTDQSGMADGWEVQYYGHLGVDPNASPTNNGITNLQAFQSGADPSDFYSGIAPVFSSLTNESTVSVWVSGYAGTSTGAIPVVPPAGGAGGLVSITLTKPDGTSLANAPVVFTLQGGGSVSGSQGGTGSTVLTVLTDGSGVAQVFVSNGATGTLSVAPQGSTSSTAVGQPQGVVDLGSGLVPVGVATDGTITLRGLNSDGTTKILRWRNGVATQLAVPSSIYAYTDIQTNMLSYFYPEHYSGLVGITPSGLVYSEASDQGVALAGYGDTNLEILVTVWPAGLQTPLALKGPLLHVPSFDPNTGLPLFTSEFSDVGIQRITNDDEIWIGSPQYLDQSRSSLGQLAIAYDSSLASALGLGTQGPSGILDANSTHQAIASDATPQAVNYYVGAPKALLPFVPIAINDSGTILGDDPPGGVETNSGQLLKNLDAYSANIVQQVDGWILTKPLIYANGQKTYLPIGSSSNVVRIVGLDSAGNVYGSFNPTYIDGAMVSPGQNVIWAAHPAQLGLSAATPAYTPVAWTQPLLGSNWQSNSMTVVPTGISPLGTGIQLGIATKTDDAAGHSSAHAFAETQTVFAVDANRDGSIKLASEDSSDATSVTRPFHFWINDDSDSGDTKSGDTDDLPLSVGSSGRNADDNQVNGVRDLVDFFPLYLDLKQLFTLLPPGTDGVSYFLKQEDAALGVVFTSYTRSQAFAYLRGNPSGLDTGFGPALTQKAGEAIVTKITASGVDLFGASPAFLARIQNNDGGVLLVEASKATSKPLVLEVRKGTDVIATVQLDIKIDPVETMFHYFNIRSQAHGTTIATNNQGPNYGLTTPSDAPNDPFQEATTSRKNVVFVHGYNVNSQEAQGSASEMFKRLYWGGSRAKFYAVLWRGDDGQGEGLAPVGATPDYHRNVGHAWQQGPYLRDLLSSLTGDTVVMAHSLGNVVTQVALTYERDPANSARLRPAARPVSVKNYFAIDAALPLEAVSGTAVNTASKALMRHPDWSDFDERLWPANWYALFPATDARSSLTWSNVFSTLDVGTNFYSSGEEVLANPDDGEIPVLDALIYSGLHAWVTQEKLKGGAARATHPAEALAIQFIRSWNAGWVTNTAWYVPIVPTPSSGPTTRQRFPSEALETSVPSASLPAAPFFKPFQASETGGFYPGYQGSRLVAAVSDTNADDEARKLVTVAKSLGEAIPALSFPLGSNSSSKFNDLGGNFDLNGSSFKNGWPTSRGTTPETQNWRHSDCINVAYTYIYPLYEKISNDGGLK